MAQAEGTGSETWALYQSAADGAAQSERDEPAERLYLQALSIAETFGPRDPRLRTTLQSLINLYLHRNDTTIPLTQLCWRLLILQEASSGPDAPELTDTIEQLARVCANEGMPAEAEALYLRRIALAERTDGAESPAVADGLIDLALHLQGQGREDEEEVLWHRAIDLAVRAEGPEGRGLVRLLISLADVYNARGRPDQAVPIVQRALAIAQNHEGLHIHITGLLERLAAAYLARGDYAKAEPLLRRALAAVEARESGGDPTAVEGLRGTYQRALEREGQYEHQRDLIRDLAIALHGLGRADEAQNLEDRAAILSAQVDARARLLADLNAVARGDRDGPARGIPAR